MKTAIIIISVVAISAIVYLTALSDSVNEFDMHEFKGVWIK